jgi:hypothetical protein
MCFTSNLEDKPKQNQHRSGDANPDQNSHCLFQLQWNMDWEHIKIKTRTTNFRLDWENREINMESGLGT